MAWKIEFTTAADKSLTKLGIETQKRIVRFLRERIANADNPRNVGKALTGTSGLWRYRVGDYRIICKIEDKKICIIVVSVGHRREIYRH